MRSLLAVLVLGMVACESPTGPSQFPQTEASRHPDWVFGTRAIVLTWQGKPVWRYPVTAWNQNGTVSILTGKDGMVQIEGRCGVPVRVRSAAVNPGWLEPLEVNPCGPTLIVSLQPLGKGIAIDTT